MMERPGGVSYLQRSCYSRRKRIPCLSYQSMTSPDGLIFSLNGPEVVRRHDITLLGGEVLQAYLKIHSEKYYAFGYDAYTFRPRF